MALVTSEYVCPVHSVKHQVDIPTSGYLEWKMGKFIQQAMPDVSADDREILLTGMCPHAWDALAYEDE